jgi:hypothetical protein
MRVKLFAAAVFAVAVAAVLVPTASAAGPTECNGTFTNTTLRGGVVVNDGDVCDLENVTVNGGLTVNGGSNFGAVLAVNNSTIHGGWSMTGIVFAFSFSTFSFVDFCGNNVDGGLNVSNVESFGNVLSFGELNAGCAGGKINGDVTLVNNDGATELDGYRVNGDLTFTGSPFSFNELEATAINGSATCQNVVDDGTSAPLVNSYTGTNNGCPA